MFYIHTKHAYTEEHTMHAPTSTPVTVTTARTLRLWRWSITYRVR